jgi:hypothetical protein
MPRPSRFSPEQRARRCGWSWRASPDIRRSGRRSSRPRPRWAFRRRRCASGSAKSRSTAGSAPASRPRRLRAKIFEKLRDRPPPFLIRNVVQMDLPPDTSHAPEKPSYLPAGAFLHPEVDEAGHNESDGPRPGDRSGPSDLVSAMIERSVRCVGQVSGAHEGVHDAPRSGRTTSSL